MVRPHTKVLAVGAAGAALVAGGLSIHANLSQPQRDTSKPIAHYEGRPFVPHSVAIDKLTKFGNIVVNAYAGNGEQNNYATASFIVSSGVSATAIMTCTPDHTLKFELTNTKLIHFQDSAAYAQQICDTGHISSNIGNVLRSLPTR